MNRKMNSADIGREGPGVIREMAAFAARYLCPENGFDPGAGFPAGIWRAMGEQGLMGLTLPGCYGGSGLPFMALAAGAGVMVRQGANLGMVMSWLVHSLVSDAYICRFADSRIRAELVPALAAGKITVAVAVSEPGVGASPKRLSASAEKTRTGYILNGIKSPVTNGPLADFFVVVAVTGERNGRKIFSSFLVPGNTPGLEIGPLLDLPILKPSGHTTIVLDNCRISHDLLLGQPDTAFETMVSPFRRKEQILMAVAFAQGMVLRAKRLAGAFVETALGQGLDFQDRLGRLLTMADAAVVLTRGIADMAEDRDAPWEQASVLRVLQGLGQESAVLVAELVDAAKPDMTLQAMGISREFNADLNGLVRLFSTGPDRRRLVYEEVAARLN